ncbi:MAG: sigma-54 dependent transcriptional regulator [Deltaproteobacteria bacterium]|jgi:two-component system response regulator AtoC|nr:sigma-54 dependent transcriptional regulator [Deltaproteobacteria bacterium]
MKKILLIDDESSLVRTLDLYFRGKGYNVFSAFDAREGLRLWRKNEPDIVLLDVQLPGMDGTQALATAKDENLPGDVIMITAFQDMEATLAAIQRGATDYLYKPLDLDSLDVLLEKILVRRREREKIERLSHVVSDSFKPNQIIGKSQATLEVLKDIARVAGSPVTVLIQGETGTGKELVARTIHQQWAPDEPFVAINCAAIVSNLLESELFGHERGAFTGAIQRKPGKLEIAGSGTLFLDEVGELPLETQAKFLRVLQEKQFQRVGALKDIAFKARLLVATNRDLESMVEAGGFREDLYFRLKVFVIRIPPLRERIEDIVPLAENFISRMNRELDRNVKRIPMEYIRVLTAYDWPGNVRELENMIRRAMILSKGEVLEIDQCWFERREPAADKACGSQESQLRSLSDMEKEHISKILRHTGGNYGEACKILGITRPTLRKKINDYGLEADHRE